MTTSVTPTERDLATFLAGVLVGGVAVWAFASRRPNSCASCGQPISELNPAETAGIPPLLQGLLDEGVRLGMVALQNGAVEIWRRSSANWQFVGVFNRWAGLQPPIEVG